MTEDAYLDWLEEELAPGKSMPTSRILLLALALVAALALVLVVDRWRFGSSAGRSTQFLSPAGRSSASSAAGPLLPSSPTSYRLGPHLVYTAELDNTTDTDLTVAYPIQLPGARASSAIVSYADLTAAGQLINFNTPPRRVAHIPAHRNVAIQIGLHVRCQSLGRRPAWPAGNSRIAIVLPGSPTAAVFTFAGLFGFNLRADLRRACDPAAIAGDR